MQWYYILAIVLGSIIGIFLVLKITPFILELIILLLKSVYYFFRGFYACAYGIVVFVKEHRRARQYKKVMKNEYIN